MKLPTKKETIRYFIEPGISAYKSIMSVFNSNDFDNEDNVKLLRYLFYSFYNIRGLGNDLKKECFDLFLKKKSY